MLLLLDTRYSFNHSLLLVPPNLLTVSPKEAGTCQNLWIPSLCSHSRGFGQSNSLPTASSVGGGMGRRNPRQYQIASRNVPSARLGLLGTSGFVSSNQRHTAANPTIMKQGRQVGSALGSREVDQAQGLRLLRCPQPKRKEMTPGDLNQGDS